MTFGERLLLAIRRRGITQSQLATMSGINDYSISQYVHDKQGPNADNLEVIRTSGYTGSVDTQPEETSSQEETSSAEKQPREEEESSYEEPQQPSYDDGNNYYDDGGYDEGEYYDEDY